MMKPEEVKEVLANYIDSDMEQLEGMSRDNLVELVNMVQLRLSEIKVAIGKATAERYERRGYVPRDVWESWRQERYSLVNLQRRIQAAIVVVKRKEHCERQKRMSEETKEVDPDKRAKADLKKRDRYKVPPMFMQVAKDLLPLDLYTSVLTETQRRLAEFREEELVGQKGAE